MSRRLIDSGLAPGVAEAGVSERYQRGRTSHTVLTWWARRPHAAMRALVFASLVADRPAHAALVSRIARGDPEAIETAKRIVETSAARRAPAVLDPFAGGGTIPIEARRLGADVTALDNNQLAVFINRCALELAADVPGDVRHRVFELGIAALAQVRRITAPVFPLRDEATDARRATTYLWTYSRACDQCAIRFLLSKRRKLSTKRKLELTHGAVGFDVCPGCGARLAKPDIRKCEDELVAVVYSDRGRGKRYVTPTANAAGDAEVIASLELALLGALGVRGPDCELPVWSGIVNPALYGMRTHDDVVTPRQRVVVLALIGAIRDVTERIEHRRFYRGVLSGLIDHAIDWNSRLSMWIPQNEQVGRALSGPGISMLWDFAETDPAQDGPASFDRKLERIAHGAAELVSRAPRGRAIHCAAQRMPFDDDTFDAVITDPPYYDNIYYAALADFVFSWKRLLLGEDEPDLFDAPATTTTDELVASRQRFGSDAHRRYTDDLHAALSEIARVLRPKGIVSLVYGHASLAGWEALITALRRSPLEVTTVEPLAIERRARPRAMRSEAINTCLVFIARRCRAPKRIARIHELDRWIESAIATAPTSSEDAALVAFANAAASLTRTAGIEGLDEVAALVHVEERIQNVYPAFLLTRRRSL